LITKSLSSAYRTVRTKPVGAKIKLKNQLTMKKISMFKIIKKDIQANKILPH
jgi:hypothetical protein